MPIESLKTKRSHGCARDRLSRRLSHHASIERVARVAFLCLFCGACSCSSDSSSLPEHELPPLVAIRDYNASLAWSRRYTVDEHRIAVEWIGELEGEAPREIYERELTPTELRGLRMRILETDWSAVEAEYVNPDVLDGVQLEFDVRLGESWRRTIVVENRDILTMSAIAAEVDALLPARFWMCYGDRTKGVMLTIDECRVDRASLSYPRVVDCGSRLLHALVNRHIESDSTTAEDLRAIVRVLRLISRYEDRKVLERRFEQMAPRSIINWVACVYAGQVEVEFANATSIQRQSDDRQRLVCRFLGSLDSVFQQHSAEAVRDGRLRIVVDDIPQSDVVDFLVQLLTTELISVFQDRLASEYSLCDFLRTVLAAYRQHLIAEGFGDAEAGARCEILRSAVRRSYAMERASEMSDPAVLETAAAEFDRAWSGSILTSSGSRWLSIVR